MKKTAYFIATGCFSGYFPVASGTAGSVVGLLLYLFLLKGVGLVTPGWGYYVLFLAFLTYLAIWSADVVAKDVGKPDPGIVVIDEILGFFISVFLLPAKFKFYIAAFIIFRILDVLKPPPAYKSQKLAGGVGICMDDIICGIYTCVFLNLTRLL